MVGVMATSSKRDLCQHAALPASQLSVPLTPGRPLSTRPPPETLKHSQASLAQAAVGTLSFLLSPAMHNDLFVPFKLPQSCGSSEIKSHWPSTQSPQVFSVPLPDPSGKPVVSVQEFVFSLSSCFLVSSLFYPFYPFVKSLRNDSRVIVKPRCPLLSPPQAIEMTIVKVSHICFQKISQTYV